MASIPGFRFDISGASGSQGLLAPKSGWKAYFLPRGAYASQDSTGALITFDSASVASRFAVNDWIMAGLNISTIRQVGAVGGNSLSISGANLTIAENDRIFVFGTTEPTIAGGVATYTPNTYVRKRDDDAADLYANSMITADSNGMVQGFANPVYFDVIIQDSNGNNQGSIVDLEVSTVASTSGTGTYNVLDYGAQGNGVVDDSANVLSAMTAAIADNGILYFPSGTYNLATWTTKNLSAPIWIKGDGIQKTILTGTASLNFVTCPSDLHVTDITFDTWSTVFNFSSITTILENVVFDSVEVKNYVRAIYASSSTSGAGIDNLKIENCRFLTGTSYPIYLSIHHIHDANIHKNKIVTAVARGIHLGNNTLSFQNDRGRYNVSGNYVTNITAVDPAASLGIALYGYRAVVTDNFVADVSKTTNDLSPDNDASDANGIYTKCRYSTVGRNVLIRAGQSEGFINIKGSARGESATQAYGFAVIVSDNVLFDDGTGLLLTNGIKLATSEVKVCDNYLEGLTEIGIYTDGDSADNYLIENNVIKNHRGSGAISVYGAGNRIRIINNHIDSVTSSFNTALQNTGIKIQKSGGTGVEIVGNYVYGITDNVTTTPVGILLKPSQVITSVRVADNHIDGADYGIQFSTTAPDDVLVSRNTFRNIATDDIKYSVLPTNLQVTTLPEPIILDDDSVQSVRGGTATQAFHIYNTYTDASNYERLAIEARLTSMRFDAQALGTGTYRTFEFWTSGVGRWKISTGGHLQGVSDNLYDIGANGANRPRDLFLSKRIFLDYTNTATIGHVTINKPTGRINVAAGTATVGVSNSFVTAASHVFVQGSSNDVTARVNNVITDSTGFTVNYTAPTGGMSMDFLVINAD